jgi:hypothetical protein
MRRRAKRRRTHQIEIPDVNNQQAVINVGQHDIGNMCYNCEYCNAKYWGHELNILNAIMMERFHSTHCLKHLLYYESCLQGIHTKQITTENIREYNLAMAFASVGAEIRLWTEFHVLKLTRNERTIESEKEFSDWLLEVGNGRSGATISSPPSCF